MSPLKTYKSLIAFFILCCSAAQAQNNSSLSGKDFILKDTFFKEPYIDIDEWRNLPIRHRYVHGGFKSTNTRFSFYFPPKEKYQGRFFQYITPFLYTETLYQG